MFLKFLFLKSDKYTVSLGMAKFYFCSSFFRPPNSGPPHGRGSSGSLNLGDFMTIATSKSSNSNKRSKGKNRNRQSDSALLEQMRSASPSLKVEPKPRIDSEKEKEVVLEPKPLCKLKLIHLIVLIVLVNFIWQLVFHSFTLLTLYLVVSGAMIGTDDLLVASFLP